MASYSSVPGQQGLNGTDYFSSPPSNVDRFGVFNTCKKESVGRRVAPRDLPVPCLYDTFKIVNGHFVPSHHNQRSYYCPYHAPKETVGADDEAPLICTAGKPLCAAYVAHRSLVLRIELAEAGEIVVNSQQLRRFIHAVKIHISVKEPA